MEIPYTVEIRPETGLYNGKLGMWFFLASEAMLFGGLFSGYVLLRTGALEWPHGRLPTNTAGGGMSEAYVHGFNLVLEGVRQIRGTSTSQVADATSSLVTSGEGVPTSAVLFRR